MEVDTCEKFIQILRESARYFVHRWGGGGDGGGDGSGGGGGVMSLCSSRCFSNLR